jgi:hypothetical protein
MDVGVWTALIMAGAGISMLALPVGLLFGLFEIPRLGLHWVIAGPLIMWAFGLAIFANFGGASAWTFASQRLPVALAAQMITMEPISGTILGLLVHHRWPSVMEVLGMIVLLVGVIIAIGIFSKSAVVAHSPAPNAPWAPVIITAEQIDAEIERLSLLSAPSNGRRSSLIVHPSASTVAPGLAPGIQVSLSVLNPGEQTTPFRHNATEVNFCIRGTGYAVTAGRRIEFGRYDTWNTPSFVPYSRGNHGLEVQACLTYSNASLLQFMQVYLWEDNPSAMTGAGAEEEKVGTVDPRRTSPYGTFQIGEDGAMLMPYELLINPPPRSSQNPCSGRGRGSRPSCRNSKRWARTTSGAGCI